jgi:mandelamide amidase
LVHADVPDVGALDSAAGFPIVFYEVLRDLPNYLADHGGTVNLQQVVAQIASPDVKGLFDALLSGAPPTTPDDVYLDAVNTQRFALQASYRRYFREQNVQAIVFPTTPLPARPIGQDQTVELNGAQVPTLLIYIRNTDPGSVSGIPGLQIPAGLTQDGLPVGIELDAPAYSDRNLLAIGLAVEEALPAIPAPPEPPAKGR